MRYFFAFVIFISLSSFASAQTRIRDTVQLGELDGMDFFDSEPYDLTFYSNIEYIIFISEYRDTMYCTGEYLTLECINKSTYRLVVTENTTDFRLIPTTWNDFSEISFNVTVINTSPSHIMVNQNIYPLFDTTVIPYSISELTPLLGMWLNGIFYTDASDNALFYSIKIISGYLEDTKGKKMSLVPGDFKLMDSGEYEIELKTYKKLLKRGSMVYLDLNVSLNDKDFGNQTVAFILY